MVGEVVGTFVGRFAAARLIVAGPHSSRSRQPVVEYVIAVVLATWALWIVDPVSRLGRYFWLGELFRYDGPGFWFGLPLGSQVGFLCTSGVLIGALTWMMRDEPHNVVPNLLRHPRFPALITYVGQTASMAGAAFVVARTTSSPAVATIADAIAGAAIIIAIPAALLTAVHWRSISNVVDLRQLDGPQSSGRARREIGEESYDARSKPSVVNRPRAEISWRPS